MHAEYRLRPTWTRCLEMRNANACTYVCMFVYVYIYVQEPMKAL